MNLSVGDAAAFARPGSNRFDLRARRAPKRVRMRPPAPKNVPQRLAVSVTGQPGQQHRVRHLPATRTVRAVVTNLGNVADSFNVSIAGTTGAVTAQS